MNGKHLDMYNYILHIKLSHRGDNTSLCLPTKGLNMDLANLDDSDI